MKAYDALSSCVRRANGVSLSAGAPTGPGGARSGGAGAAGSSLPRWCGHRVATDAPAEPHERLADLAPERAAVTPEGGPLGPAIGLEARLALPDVREPELDVLHGSVLSRGGVMAGRPG